ncbi:MAG: SufE family protein [Pseudomonadota bacterium]
MPMSTSSLVPMDEIEDTLELLDDWEDRYRYIIELGRNLPEMPVGTKTDATKVRGCSSQVWLFARNDNAAQPMELYGDSDAHIVRGLVAILLALYQGKTPADAAKTDARAALEKLALAEHLSPTRTNGLFSMIERIEQLATEKAAA